MNIENVEKTENNISTQTSSQTQKTKKKEEDESFEKLVDSVKKKDTDPAANKQNLKNLKDFTKEKNEDNQLPFGKYNEMMFQQNLIGLNLKDKNQNDIQNISKKDRGSRETMFNFNTKTFKIDNMSAEDEQFLKLLSSKTTMVIDKMNTQTKSAEVQIQTQEGMGVSYKTLDFSKGLFNLVEYAYNVQKPVRLEFSGNSSVILKVDKEGQLSAEFLSSDKAMEAVLKNNIPFLKNKLDSEGVPYKQISYKEDQSKDQQQRQNERNKGE